LVDEVTVKIMLPPPSGIDIRLILGS